MSSNANTPTTTKVILTQSEDWEKWFWQLQSNVSGEIWLYIDPEGDESALLETPKRPELADFDQNARSYAQLSAANQHTYENARRYYDQDRRYYSRQQDQLQAARAYITATVSEAKWTSLDPKLSVREWLKDLKKDNEPPEGYMLTQTERRYRNTLKNFKSNKLFQWLQEWEATMIECIKYDLPEVQNGRWLRDLAQLIRAVSEVYSVQFTKDASDKTKSDPKEFRRVARELREMLETQKGGRTIRGNAFHVSFAESSEEGSDAKSTQGTEQAPPKGRKGRKRSGTQSNEAKAPKKAVPECPACGMRGHSLSKCWCIFEELKPEGMTLTASRVRKAKKTVEDDEQLTAEVQEIRQKMDEEAKKKTK
jgi:hypothetical protein